MSPNHSKRRRKKEKKSGRLTPGDEDENLGESVEINTKYCLFCNLLAMESILRSSIWVPILRRLKMWHHLLSVSLHGDHSLSSEGSTGLD